MEMTREVWAFVVALAAVVNGLGIVRLIGGFGDYLRKRHVLEVEHYLPFTAMAFFQLLTHALLWWSILGLKSAGSINPGNEAERKRIGTAAPVYAGNFF